MRVSPLRRAIVSAALTSIVSAACAGGVTDSAATAPSATSAPTTTLDVIRDAGVAAPVDADGAAGDEPWSVSVDVVADGFDLPPAAGEMSATFDPVGPRDAFGDAAFCSGLHESVAAYSVFVSGDTAGDAVSGADPIDFVGVWTVQNATGPGIYEADMRVEQAGASYDATGTVTLADDLQSGDFVGFGATGGSIEGSFECRGDDPPTPLQLGSAADGALDSVEVVALVRSDGRRRVVELATADRLLVACPAVEGTPGDPAVAVRGGARLGSITEFEIDATGLTLVVGGVRYEFDTVTLDADRGAGAFGAENADGIVIDGAFRCT